MSIGDIRSKLLDALNVMALSPKPLQGRLADAYRIGIETIDAYFLRDEQRRLFEFVASRLASTSGKSVEEVCDELSEDDAATIAMRLKMLFEGVDNAWLAFRLAEKRAA